VIDAIHRLMERETAGDPISGLKWTRKTTDKIARQLQRLGIAVGRNTVGRLLRQMQYSLRTNRKKISAGSTSDRDRPFCYLCRQAGSVREAGRSGAERGRQKRGSCPNSVIEVEGF
jgi:hypothetical protein